MTGWGRGRCLQRPPGMLGTELEPTPSASIVEAERPPTDQELALWDRAEQLMRRCVLKGYAARLKHAQIIAAAKHGAKYGTTINIPEMADLETRMNAALTEIEDLRRYHCDVNGLHLGVRLSADGKDLDILSPAPMSMGAIWIPMIAIGAVILVGIIARWVYLESEVQEVNNKYNGVISKANMALCENPDSDMCKDWNKSKQTGDYYKRQTLLDKVESAVTTVGKAAKSGLSWGVMLAIPMLLYLYAPRRKGST